MIIIFFGLDKVLYVCFAYIPPQYSSFYVDQNVDFLDLLDNGISFYRNKGSVLILGDFNAKTGSEPDFNVNDDNSYILLHDDYIIDNTLLRRNSQDIKVCTRGRDLLDVCISSGIRILN